MGISVNAVQKNFESIPTMTQITRSAGHFTTTSTSEVDIPDVLGLNFVLEPLEYWTIRGNMRVRSTGNHHHGNVRVRELTTGNLNIIGDFYMRNPYPYGAGFEIEGTFGVHHNRNTLGVTLSSYKMTCHNSYEANLCIVRFYNNNDTFVVQGKYIIPNGFINSEPNKLYIGVKQYIEQVKIISVSSFAQTYYNQYPTFANFIVYSNTIPQNTLTTVSVQGIDANGLTIANDQTTSGQCSVFLDWSGFRITVGA